MPRPHGNFRVMIIGMLLWAGAIAGNATSSPFARVMLAQRHARQAIERVDELPDAQDLRQRTILIRDGRDPVIVTARGRPIA